MLNPMSRRLLLFGTPRWLDGETSISLPVDKPASLLYHLAQRGDWVTRNELAFLYRPDADAEIALANVRKLLHRAREHPWAAGLEVERFRVRFELENDAGLFRQAVMNERWEDALELYTGRFLEGLSLPDVPGYEAWLDLERADLGRNWQRAARRRAQQLEVSGDLSAAGSVLESLLRHDPFDEEALQAYLQVLNAQGQRKQALEVFDAFRTALAAEVEVEPLEATRALADAIRHGGDLLGAANSATTSESPRHNVAAPTTRFVGRRRELLKLGQILAEPDGRLVTLIGLGGVGKTRLATEFAWSQIQRFAEGIYADGIWFVALANTVSIESLAPSVAAALGAKLTGSSDPKQQLFDHLRPKQMLLLLDNFEHLLSGAGFVAELLEAAAGVRIVVTSRSALELSGEWLIDLEGLACPPLGTTQALETFDAVKLFVNRSERVTPNFTLESDALSAVAALCRLVEGLPLALELAATWMRTLGVAEIVTELELGLERLAATQHDVPERHRSLRAVFDHSWMLLSNFEREVLMRLSVFRGSWTLHAAVDVAGAHLSSLTSLINRSLVQRAATGRYAMHEFIRQLAIERLELGAEAIEVKERHALFFAAQLELVEPSKANEHRPERLRELDADFDNVLTAWNHLGQCGHLEIIERATGGLAEYLHLRGRRVEGMKAFQNMSQQLERLVVTPIVERVQARLALGVGMDASWLGRMQEAESSFEHALTLAARIGATKIEGESSRQLGIVAQLRGDRDAAQERFSHSLGIFTAADNRHGMAFCYHSLGQVAKLQGKSEIAREHLTHSIALFAEVADGRNQAMALNDLGNMSFNEGALIEARDMYTRCLDIFEVLGFAQGVAALKGNLGGVARKLGDFDAALTLTLESLELKRRIGDARGTVNAQINLGLIHTERADFAQARKFLLEAIGSASARIEIPLALTALSALAQLALRTDDPTHAAIWFGIVAAHPASSAEDRTGAQRSLETLGSVAAIHDPQSELSAVIRSLLPGTLLER
jgi:predicted ATPase/DNA-binding SARP family transcriptional activator